MFYWDSFDCEIQSDEIGSITNQENDYEETEEQEFMDEKEWR